LVIAKGDVRQKNHGNVEDDYYGFIKAKRFADLFVQKQRHPVGCGSKKFVRRADLLLLFKKGKESHL